MFDTLITAAQLAQQVAQNSQEKVQKENLVIVDCRHDLMDVDAGRNAYLQGHIEGAQFVHLDQDLSGKKFSDNGVFLGRHPLPSTENLLMTLRHLGINDDSQVVAYDAHGGMFAARLWWLLRSLGHRAVAVLDGGLSAWTSAGHSLQVEVVTAQIGHLQQRTSLTTQVDVLGVLANMRLPSAEQRLVVDARAPDRFRGENESIDPVGGHIPSAVNRFFKDNLQAEGRFKAVAQLRQEWQTVLSNSNLSNPNGQVSDSSKAIMQCGSGVTACHNILALEVAGLSGAALYPGSWSEWCADPTRPVSPTRN
ncbi:MAG: sulfurtransferase [Undibacterium sp.]|nr:sulfurtransferase [Undibacterium sp.]